MMPPEATHTTIHDESSPTSETDVTRVVVVGAGPAGLLASILLLRRNEQENSEKDDDTKRKKKYHVTLIDPGVNYGLLDEEGLKRHRSWMIGLASHGLSSIQSVPDLYEKYIENVGIKVQSATIGFGKHIRFNRTVPEEELKSKTNGLIVDRNYICAGLSRYLNESYSSFVKDGSSTATAMEEDVAGAAASMFTALYGTRALFVDAEQQCVHVRPNADAAAAADASISPLPAGQVTTIPYDLLLGCDGIRSVVRNAFVTNHREFEMDLTNNFGRFKSFHIPLPSNVDEGRFVMLAGCVPNMTTFILPERGGQLNIGMVYSLNKPCDDILMNGTDPKEVAKYFAKYVNVYDGLDWDYVGESWVKQPWTRTGLGHCNFYHSLKLNALLLGDAAHPTEPNIGQGMNTALADAAAFDRLLTAHNDNLEIVLPEFSKLRVKEGNALTELSSHTYNVSGWMMMEIVIRQHVHQTLNLLFPSIVPPEPMQAIRKGMDLSVAYDKVSRLGYLQRSRRINLDVAREYFERESGMVTSKATTLGTARLSQILVVLVSVAGGFYYRNNYF